MPGKGSGAAAIGATPSARTLEPAIRQVENPPASRREARGSPVRYTER